ncbi:MAG: hypothetical protein ACYT04_74890 [Nostoc sp.]
MTNNPTSPIEAVNAAIQSQNPFGCGSFKKRKNEVRQALGVMVE